MSDAVEFESHRFGRVQVRESELLQFPGLPGFPEARRFVVMEHDRESPFAWLVSADDPDLAFAITDPFQFFPDYRPPLERWQVKALGVERPEDLVIMSIASFSGGTASLNLMAPLLINPRVGRGVQVILDRSPYSARERLPEASAPKPGSSPK
jgi:flagellar assembly factor FliW